LVEPRVVVPVVVGSSPIGHPKENPASAGFSLTEAVSGRLGFSSRTLPAPTWSLTAPWRECARARHAGVARIRPGTRLRTAAGAVPAVSTAPRNNVGSQAVLLQRYRARSTAQHHGRLGLCVLGGTLEAPPGDIFW